jgi:DNA topoisomerase VI subunit B
MTKLAEMLAVTLDSRESRTLEQEDARKVLNEYLREVSASLEEINRRKMEAVEETRFVMCR